MVPKTWLMVSSVSNTCVSCTGSVAFCSAFTSMSSSGLHSSRVEGVRGDFMIFCGTDEEPERGPNSSHALVQCSCISLFSHASPWHGGGMCQQAWVQIQTALPWLLWLLLGWQSS